MRVTNPENLVSFLQALLGSGAVLQHPRHEDTHIVSPGQTQAHTLPLPKLHQLHTRSGTQGNKQEGEDAQLYYLFGTRATL